MSHPSTDPSRPIVLLCHDGTVAVMGKSHNEVIGELTAPKGYSTIWLTRETGEALRDMLNHWLGPKDE